MSNEQLLSLFIPMVDFLGAVLGKNSEIVLHDVSTPEHSIIAIHNGFHSGRHVGSSMTNFAVQIQTDKRYQGQDFITNYRASSQGKNFLSSTYYIKNNENLIGMLCINTDTSASQELLHTVNQFIESFNLSPITSIENEKVEENLDVPIVSYVDSVIEKTISESGILPDRMNRDEKMEIVKKLNEQGIPRMKGAVSEIAKQLKISESTVYRYINQ